MIHAATGDRFEGTIAWHRLGRDLFMIVDDSPRAPFRISTWRAGSQTGAQVWMTTYAGEYAARVRKFGQRAQPIVDRAVR